MPRRSKPGLPKLPQLLEQKLSKTGQTRGADDDVIFQNRVSRSNTVLIPFRLRETDLWSIPSVFEWFSSICSVYSIVSASLRNLVMPR